MMSETFKKFSVIIGVAFLVLFIAIWFFTRRDMSKKNPQNSSGVTEQVGTREPVPENVSVPNVGEKDLPSNVAIPSSAIPAASKSEHMLRRFSLTAQGGKFIPDTFIASLGDIIHIDIKAIDGTYNFIQTDFGLTTTVKQGETRVVEFSPSAEGKVTFSCTVCGPGSVPAKGYVIVVKEGGAN